MIIDSVPQERWQQAQEAELECQLPQAGNPHWEWEMFRYYYLLLFGNFIKEDWHLRTVMEVGVGTAGVLWLTNAEIKVAVEPLAAKFIEQNPSIYSDYQRIIPHGAESLPEVADNSIDGVICLNVLDHCQNPRAVLDEMFRVLKHHGKLEFCCDLKSQEGHLDQAHPIALSQRWFQDWWNEKMWFCVKDEVVRSRSIDSHANEMLDGCYVFHGVK